MRPGSTARAKSPAAAMGGTAAEAIRRSQHRRIRAIVPDRRAAAADAGLCQSEAVAGGRSRHDDDCTLLYGTGLSRAVHFTPIYPKATRCKFHNASYDECHSKTWLSRPIIEEHPAMATASDPVVIVSAARTPLGRFMGD